MYGYAVRARNTGMVKIGVTKHLKNRFGSYKTHCSEPVELVYAADFKEHYADAENWERKVLTYYKDHRSHGEWIAPNPDLESSIEIGVICGEWSREIFKYLEREPFIALPKFRTKIRKSGEEWLAYVCGFEGYVETWFFDDWDTAQKFARWHIWYGLEFRSKGRMVFELAVEKANLDILSGKDPATQMFWREGFDKWMAREQKERGE